MPGAKKWYVERDVQRRGPYANREIREMVRTGDVLPSDLLWKEGMAAFVPAERFPKLFKRVGPKRYSGPSVKLMAVAGLLLTLAIVASPVSELTRGLSGWASVACFVLDGLLFFAFISVFVVSLIGSERKRLVVPAQGRLLRVSVEQKDVSPVPDCDAEPVGQPHRPQEAARQGGIGVRSSQLNRSSVVGVAEPSQYSAVRFKAAVVGLVVLVTGGIISMYCSAEKTVAIGPYSFLPVSGQVVSDGGKPLSGRPMLLRFTPEGSADPAAVVVPPGLAAVNPRTGRFRAMIAAARGQEPRKWRVAVVAQDEQALPADFLPLVFSDSTTTPIVVELGEGDITIKLPTH
jgi:hypothetical protein